MSPCMRYLVSGRVQGVFFRAATRNLALSLGLTGWARNLPDGCVEVLACGDGTQLEALHHWLWEGPPHAQVQDVQCEPAPAEDLAGFNII